MILYVMLYRYDIKMVKSSVTIKLILRTLLSLLTLLTLYGFDFTNPTISNTTTTTG